MNREKKTPHGEHDGENYNPIAQSVGKLQPFFKSPVVYFPHTCCTSQFFCCCYFLGPKAIIQELI